MSLYYYIIIIYIIITCVCDACVTLKTKASNRTDECHYHGRNSRCELCIVYYIEVFRTKRNKIIIIMIFIIFIREFEEKLCLRKTEE